MNIYLVQRVKQKLGEKTPTPTEVANNSDLTVDRVYGMDYMGSAEFEFGALPKSLKTILGQHASGNDPLTAWNTGVKNRDNEDIYVVSGEHLESNETILEFVQDQISYDIHNSKRKSYRLKEMTRMFDAIGDCPQDRQSSWHNNLVIWWDVENHFFICKDKTEARRLSSVLLNTMQKFKDAGKIAA